MTVALAVRFLHLAAALTWAGGILFVALVLVPVTRRLEDPALCRRLMHEAGMPLSRRRLGGHSFR